MADCPNGTCNQPTLPGTRRLHRYLHDSVDWYRDWHHHPLRPHVHLGVLVMSVFVLGMVVLTPNKTGIKAEIVGLPVSGKLIDVAGTPVRDGTHNAVFRLYSVERGGIAQWTEVHEGAHRLLTVNGIYTVELGLLNRFDGTSLAGRAYLGISVDGGPELAPRVEIDPATLQALTD